MESRLTIKQQRFVAAYLGEANGNATKAALLAGYPEPSAHTIGWENLQKPAIREAVRRLFDANSMLPEEIVARLTDQARASLGDFFDVADDGKSWVLNLAKAEAAGKLHLLKKIGHGPGGPTVELHDAQAALAHLGRFRALFTDVVRVKAEVSAQRLEELRKMPPDELVRIHSDALGELAGE